MVPLLPGPLRRGTESRLTTRRPPHRSWPPSLRSQQDRPFLRRGEIRGLTPIQANAAPAIPRAPAKVSPAEDSPANKGDETVACDPKPENTEHLNNENEQTDHEYLNAWDLLAPPADFFLANQSAHDTLPSERDQGRGLHPTEDIFNDLDPIENPMQTDWSADNDGEEPMLETGGIPTQVDWEDDNGTDEYQKNWAHPAPAAKLRR